MPVFGRKLNRILAIAFAVVSLIFAVEILQPGNVWPWPAVAVAVFWSYPLAIILLVEWAWGRFRRRGVPAVPGLPERVCRGRGVWIGLAAWVVLVTLAREGAFAPEFVLSVDWWSAHDQWNVSRNAGGTSTTTGDAPGPPQFAGQPLGCTVSCSSIGDVCKAVVEQLGCDPNVSADRTGLFTLSVADPWCYTPLLKEAVTTVRLDGSLNASLRSTEVDADGFPQWTAQKGVSVDITGTLDTTMNGVVSCWGFRQHVASELATGLRNELNTILSEN